MKRFLAPFLLVFSLSLAGPAPAAAQDEAADEVSTPAGEQSEGVKEAPAAEAKAAETGDAAWVLEPFQVYLAHLLL